MLRIALCDDDSAELARVTALLERYQTRNRFTAQINAFQNALDLMDALHSRYYQLLLLDILMPGFTGMQAARELRCFNSETKIIFITSSPEFAVESYGVNAYYYLLKPIEEFRLFPVLDRLLLQLQRQEQTLLLTLPSGLVRLSCSRIEVVEVNSKRLLFYLNDGSVQAIHATLTEYEHRLLSTGRFVKVHRSYLVNMGDILQLKGSELVTCSGRVVPVSRLLSNQVKKEYMDFLFRKEDDRP